MMRAIMYTRDGGVSICYPARACLRALTGGGCWANFTRGFIDVQVERQIARGISTSVALRFARAMVSGGCTDAEALAIIRDRDCAQGIAHELVDPYVDLPDRWFRNAWRRSHNGGTIYVHMPTARNIQFDRIRRAAETARADLQIERWRERVRRAMSPDELARVWPAALREKLMPDRVPILLGQYPSQSHQQSDSSRRMSAAC